MSIPSNSISGTKFDDCHRPHNRHQHEDGDFGRLWPETENPAVIGMLIGLDLHQLQSQTQEFNDSLKTFTFNIKTSKCIFLQTLSTKSHNVDSFYDAKICTLVVESLSAPDPVFFTN